MEWNDQMIDDALQHSAASVGETYPPHWPPASALWTAIETKRSRGKLVRLKTIAAVAATTLLLATAATVWLVMPATKPSPVVHRHQQPPAPAPTEEAEAITYIQQLCAGNNIVCHSPAFKELQTELNASASELTGINQQLKLFGNDEQLLRAKTRIENHQARIVKAMLQIL